MRPMKLMQWIGVAIAALGAALMLNSGPLSQVWMSAHLPSGFPVHLDLAFSDRVRDDHRWWTPGPDHLEGIANLTGCTTHLR